MEVPLNDADQGNEGAMMRDLRPMETSDIEKGPGEAEDQEKQRISAQNSINSHQSASENFEEEKVAKTQAFSNSKIAPITGEAAETAHQIKLI